MHKDTIQILRSGYCHYDAFCSFDDILREKRFYLPIIITCRPTMVSSMERIRSEFAFFSLGDIFYIRNSTILDLICLVSTEVKC